MRQYISVFDFNNFLTGSFQYSSGFLEGPTRILPGSCKILGKYRGNPGSWKNAKKSQKGGEIRPRTTDFSNRSKNLYHFAVSSCKSSVQI